MRKSSSAPWRRLSGVIAGVLTATAGFAGFGATPAAQAVPLPSDPATVTAEALPTWQLNGVVWSTVVVGNTAYVTGDFSQARPPGEPVGSALSIDAKNIFAFDVTTGNPVSSFSHSLNAQGLIIRANDDGSRIYVGGDFTTVDGVARGHIASFDTATGALNAFDARTDGQVRGLAFAGSTVYAGGNFRSSNGQPRSLFAAYQAATGNLTSWAPVGDTEGYVFSMVASPDKSRIIAGGSFSTINGSDAYGMGAIDAATGTTLPWAANARLRAAGLNGAIDTLSTDGTSIFGAGYSYGSGAAFEGTFSADPSTGSINWVNDCLGDTYDTFPMGGALYTVGHEHDCTIAGAFPDTSPRSRWQKATAERITPALGTISSRDAYNWDYTGLPYTGLLHWYPDLEFGSYTSSRQAAWSIGGNGNYLVLGGEFPKVNNVAQQSLTRFAKRPISAGLKPVASSGSTPTPVPSGNGAVRVVFGAMFDRDDAVTEYDIYRTNGSTRIATISRNDAEFWSLPKYGYNDTGLPVGSQVRYQVRARDAAGNFQWSAWSGYVTVTDGTSAYAGTVAGHGANHLWRLGEAVGSTVVVDSIGDGSGAPSASVTLGGSGALLNETNTATTNTANSMVVVTAPETAPAAVSVEAWVRTTSVRGGRIAGFGNNSNYTSTLTDRVLYLDTSGRPNFMINDTAPRTVTARSGINDGNWHHVVGTVDAAGLQLFVDGVRVGRDQRFTTPRSYAGYWKLGSDTVNGFANKPSDTGLVGSVDEVATYPRALSMAEVQSHFTASGRTGAWTPQPTDAYSAAVLAQSPDLFWQLGEASGNALDGSGAGNYGNVTTAALSVTRGGEGPIAGNTAATFNGSSGAVVAQQQWQAPSQYTAEVWFKTATTRGGKLIGFGNTSTGLSSSYDRHVYMLNTGKLAFGVSSGTQQIVTSPLSYNDNQWHHVAATQGANGMKLYVDGLLVGSNPTTTAQAYTGYWRIGGDRVWSGATSGYFAGSLDEAAVYASALSETDVRAHYIASGRTAPNRPPVATFTSTKSFLTLTVDGSASTDPDGPLASYLWNFGDGTTASEATASHTYAAAGTYPVSLTVTDGSGATNTSTQTITVALNQAPIAAFASEVTLHEVAFSAAASSDPDGTIASYAWNFGDEQTGSGEQVTHDFGTAGTFPVTLTVTDDQGATTQVVHEVTTVDPPNQLPTAAFTTDADDLAVAFDAGTSTDPDGTLVSWDWNFGGTNTATGRTAAFTFAEPGTHPVTLTVTDNRGGTATLTKDVTVRGPNQLPSAAFEWTADKGEVAFDAAASGDPDGTLESYAWDFGDGTDGTGASPEHTYTESGSYTVRLTVTDDRNGTATASHEVEVVVNAKPTAAFSHAKTFLQVTFDGSGSSDSDGTVESYAWDFGDGSEGTGAGPDHTYAAAGTYSVKLTVTDDDGSKDSVTHSVTVVRPDPLAADTFGRSVSGGWGTADNGGAWTFPLAGTSRFSVADGVGRVSMATAGSGYTAVLNSVKSTQADLSFDVTIDKPATGTGLAFSAIGRHVAGAGSYSGKVKVLASGAVVIYLLKTVGGTETVFASQTVSGMTFTAGDTFKVRLQAIGTGTTALKLKVWKSGAEPAAWNLSATDSTAALQVAGGVGIGTNVSASATNVPIVYTFDNLLVPSP